MNDSHLNWRSSRDVHPGTFRSGGGQRIPLLIRLVTVSVCCLLSVPAAGEESYPLAFRAPPNLPKESGEKLETLARQHADKMNQQMQLHLQAVDRACGLSGQQRSKLELAAQGAVQDSVEEWLAPILAELASGNEQSRELLLARLGAGRGQMVEDLGGGQRVIVHVDDMAIVEQPPQRGFFGQLFFGGGRRAASDLNLDESAVLRHPIFTGTLEAVLTEEQQARLSEVAQEKRDLRAEAERAEQQRRDEAEARRDAERQQIRTERLVRQIGRRLELDDAQLERMTGAVEQIEVDHVVRWRTGASGISSKDAAEFTMPHLPVETMREILTPGQFAVWEEIVQQSKKGAAGESKASE